jgi:type IV pilus assembly protein PilE
MSMLTRRYEAAAAGFSLIELMVTVAIVAILATIAVSSYSNSVLKSRRTDARSAILDLAGREEKLFSTNNAYSAAPVDLGYGTATSWPAAGMAIGSGYYTIVVALQASPVGYTITATPAGPQVKDVTCTTLFVDQTGAQNATPTANSATCWGR